MSEYIQHNFDHVRDRNNGDPVYRDSLGNEFTFERSRNHWDITFRGTNPEPTQHESNENQPDAGVHDELEPHYDAHPPMGTPTEDKPNPPDMGVPTESMSPDMGIPNEPNPPDMGAPAESMSPDMGIPTEPMPSDMSIPSDGGQPHDAVPNFSLPDGSQISIPADRGQNITPADAGQNLTPVDAGQNITPAEGKPSNNPSGEDNPDARGYEGGNSDAGGSNAEGEARLVRG